MKYIHTTEMFVGCAVICYFFEVILGKNSKSSMYSIEEKWKLILIQLTRVAVGFAVGNMVGDELEDSV